MPKSISQVQANYISSGCFVGEDSENFELFEAKNELEKLGPLFIEALGRWANKKGVVATGKLISDSFFKMADDGNTLQIWMPDYFDYPNEGVKGVRSSKNAPGSPYQYKNYGMSQEGRNNIRKYIAEGRAKIDTVVKKRDKALGIGREGKQLSLLDNKTNQLIYLIKRFGIKKTGYFTGAVNEVFKDFELKMVGAVEKDIVFTLEKINRK